MPSQSRVLPLALLLLSAAPCQAQTWNADSAVRQFAWGPVHVLVIADTVAGLGLWAATSSLDYEGDRHEFGASFNPDSIGRWLDQAHAVLAHGREADSTSATALQTAPLIALDSSAIVVLRERDVSRWSDQAQLVFLGKDRKPMWSVAANAEEASDFVTSMFVQAARSRLLRMSPSDSLAAASSSGLGDAAPRLIKAGLVQRPKSIAGISAYVALRFVVGTDGKVERASVRTVRYSDARFVDAAIETIMRSRFAPGKLNGIPVRVMVAQGVTFHGQAQGTGNFPRPRPQVGDIQASPPF